MKLDKRIKNIEDIKSVTSGCHDFEFMNKKGYFADSILEFEDLKNCSYGEYREYREHDKCFGYSVVGDIVDFYKAYFIPEDVLKPEEPKKKYKPYSLNEFLDEHEIGDKITFRLKLDKQPEDFIRHKVMICGYQIVTGEANTPGKGFINLGGTLVSLQTLFEDYETPNSYLYPEVWEPFGVLDE